MLKWEDPPRAELSVFTSSSWLGSRESRQGTEKVLRPGLPILCSQALRNTHRNRVAKLNHYLKIVLVGLVK